MAGILRAITFTFSLPYTPPTLSPPLAGLDRNVIEVLATAITGSMVGMIVGVRLGAAVNVALGSSVFVGLDVGKGSGVFVGTSVDVTAESPGRPQLVSRESKSTKLKTRMYLNDMFLLESGHSHII